MSSPLRHHDLAWLDEQTIRIRREIGRERALIAGRQRAYRTRWFRATSWRWTAPAVARR